MKQENEFGGHLPFKEAEDTAKLQTAAGEKKGSDETENRFMKTEAVSVHESQVKNPI